MIWRKLIPILAAASVTASFVLGVVLGRMTAQSDSANMPAWNQSSHTGSQSEQALKELLYEYGQFLNALIDEGRTLTVEETIMWIDRFEEPTWGCDNLVLRQSGYIALISLCNGIEDWLSSEQYCLSAIADAPNAYVEFERLGDLYAVQAEAENAGLQRLADRTGMDTFGMIRNSLKSFQSKNELSKLSHASVRLARWAHRYELRKALDRDLGDATVATRAADLARFFEVVSPSFPDAVDATIIRNARARAAAAHVSMGHTDQAIDVFSIYPQLPATAHEYLRTYIMLEEEGVDFTRRARFVSSLNLTASDDPDALSVSNRLARDALAIRTSFIGSPAGVADNRPDESMTKRTRDAIEFAMIDHERIVSNALVARERQASKATTHSSIEQMHRLRYGLSQLTSYLRQTGQHDAADEYAMMLSRDFGDDSYLRD